MNFKKIISCVCVLGILISIFSNSVSAEVVTLIEQSLANNDMLKVEYNVANDNIKYYNQVLDEYTQKFYKETSNQSITLLPKDAKSMQEIKLQTGVGENLSEALICSNEQDFYWTFEVPEDGLYQIYVTYYALEGKGNAISRNFKIDDVVPFEEALNVKFGRKYVEIGEPSLSENGDQIRPPQKEIYEWTHEGIYDANGFYAEPFKLYFSKGTHKFSLDFVSEPLAISKIEIFSPKKIKSYADVKMEYESKGYNQTNQALQKFQAEKSSKKSDPTVRSQSQGDPSVQPSANGDFVLNVFGDSRWSKGNQWAEWKFTVPADGLYQISFKAGQWFNNGNTSYRQVSIDGEVPFKELLEFGIAYNRDWQNVILGDGKAPYLIYLKAGESHTIRLTSKTGKMASVVNSMNDLTLMMSKILRDIVKVTGTLDNIDVNFQYQLEKKVPGLIDDLKYISNELQKQMDYINTISKDKPTLYYSFISIKKTIDEMIAKPDIITIRASELTNAQTSFGQWMQDLQLNSLTIDYIMLSNSSTNLPKVTANFFEKVKASFSNLIKSFYKDYNNIGSTDKNKNKIIKVWVSLGREWTEVLRDLSDNEFTPKTGISVQFNTFPGGQLNSGAVNVIMLAINSGKAPDVAIGVDSQSPVEFAIRGAVLDLSKFNDYSEIKSRFINGATIPFEYNKGTYALPCQQDFNVIFYRKDILSTLKTGLPQTWTDLYKILPILQSNGYNFYCPPLLDPFLFQKGGDFYNQSKTASALETPEAYKAFKEWTELYTNYKIPQAANFFNRFRSGEMPIGVGSYTDYVTLTIGAPELQGRWAIAPFLGTKKADGTIDRTMGSPALSTNIILEKSSMKDASWEFLKWWMSDDIQIRFGKQIEGIVGIGAKWNSANTNAFKELPWGKDEIKTITDQWNQFKAQPVLPGSYSTARYVNFAWVDVVVSGKSLRDSLETAVTQINKELKLKQEEYGLNINN